jgi:hypothetical protein
MNVGGYEAHGLGWREIRHDERDRPYRLMAREASLFLRNTGKPMISVEIGGERPRVVSGQILVNGKALGVLRVRPGWQERSFPLGHEDAEVLAVTLKLPSADSGVGVHRVELVDRADRRPQWSLIRRIANSRWFLRLEDAWRVAWHWLRVAVRYLVKDISRRLG